MKNIILAAGYATRLYPLTENFPKPLLKIGESTILDRLVADIDRLECIDEHIIVTNHKFLPQFEAWAAHAKYSKSIRIMMTVPFAMRNDWELSMTYYWQ